MYGKDIGIGDRAKWGTARPGYSMALDREGGGEGTTRWTRATGDTIHAAVLSKTGA